MRHEQAVSYGRARLRSPAGRQIATLATLDCEDTNSFLVKLNPGKSVAIGTFELHPARAVAVVNANLFMT